MNLNDVMKLRKLGLSIFPVDNATKVPLVAWKPLQEKLPTIEEVNEWFSQNGRSVGVATGKISNLFLLDFDFAKHPESKEWYEKNKTRFPKTWTEATKNGGLHLYFTWSEELDKKKSNTTGVIAVGVDTKGGGGYSKMAPSEGYKWIIAPWVMPLAKPPQWLIDSLQNKDDVKGGFSLKTTLDGIKDGARNNDFTALAGSLRARGYKTEDIYSLLEPKAKELNFPEGELATICQSVGRYPAPEIRELTNDGQGVNIATFLDDIQTIEWICEGIIAKGSIGFIAGLPETGKTWALIDLAIECARGGGTWLKKFPVKGCKVLFIDQERAKSETQRRLKAVLAGKGLLAIDIRDSINVRCGTTTRIDLQHSFDAFRKELNELKPDLVIVDSFATFHTREESNRMEIQFVLEKIKQLRNEFGCTFLFVHHETKMAFQNRKEGETPSYLDMAGNVAIPAVAETVLNVVKHDDNTSFIHHTKSTMGPKIAPFLMKVVDLNINKSQISVEAY